MENSRHRVLKLDCSNLAAAIDCGRPQDFLNSTVRQYSLAVGKIRWPRALLRGIPMTTQTASAATVVTLVSMLIANTAAAQPMSTCVENSPERRGEIGCSIIESKVLPDGLKEPVFWHIDRFESSERARTAVGPSTVAFGAAGTSWLLTIESQASESPRRNGMWHTWDRCGCHGPRSTRPCWSSRPCSRQVCIPLVHHHSGVEAVYVIDGEACYETPTRAAKLRKGETLALSWRNLRCGRWLPDRHLVASSSPSSSTTPPNLPRCR